MECVLLCISNFEHFLYRTKCSDILIQSEHLSKTSYSNVSEEIVIYMKYNKAGCPIITFKGNHLRSHLSVILSG